MEDITVQELKSRMDKGENLMIIDVREPWEFEEFNIGAKLFPLNELPAHLQDLEKYKETEIIVHCKAGGRSATAKAIMGASGFTSVRNLLGGMMAWQAETRQ